MFLVYNKNIFLKNYIKNFESINLYKETRCREPLLYWGLEMESAKGKYLLFNF